MIVVLNDSEYRTLRWAVPVVSSRGAAYIHIPPEGGPFRLHSIIYAAHCSTDPDLSEGRTVAATAATTSTTKHHPSVTLLSATAPRIIVCPTVLCGGLWA